eukprot:symbB.v1.2.021740.t1/scaffold1878.1/size97411/1
MSTDFWDLHRRLGECYEADVGRRQPKGATSSVSNNLNPFHRQVSVNASPRRVVPAQSFDSPKVLPPGEAPPAMMAHTYSAGSPRLEEDFLPVVASRASTTPARQVSEQPAARQVSLPQAAAASHGTGSMGLGGILQNSDVEGPLPFVAVPRACWRKKAKRDPSHARSRPTVSVASKTANELIGAPFTSQNTFVISPMGHFRNFWDFLGIVYLFMDTIILPIQFVNQGFLYEFPWLGAFSKFVLAYWCCDVVLSFFTAYLERGELVTNHKAIACHYFKTWFLPDFAVTVIDIALEFSESESQTDRASTRVLRLLRLFRVIRLGKVTRFASFLRDTFESEVAYTQFSLLLLIVGMMLQEHVIACGWFGIAYAYSDESTWLTMNEKQNVSFTMQYTASLRWAFSHLGVGGTNIEAVNEREGVYSVSVALVSLITASSIVSSMTSLVSTLQSKRMETTQQFGMLRRFLRVNKIEEGLSHRITRFLHYTYHERSSQTDEPYILDYLSNSLMSELRLARYSASLSKMDFIFTLLRSEGANEVQVLQRIASQALAVLDFAEDDVIFFMGTEATSAYLNIHGRLQYWQPGMEEPVVPRDDTWIAEMCLWMNWNYAGDLRCGSFGKLLVLQVQEFCDIICKFSEVQVQVHKWVTTYVEEWNEGHH